MIFYIFTLLLFSLSLSLSLILSLLFTFIIVHTLVMAQCLATAQLQQQQSIGCNVGCSCKARFATESKSLRSMTVGNSRPSPIFLLSFRRLRFGKINFLLLTNTCLSGRHLWQVSASSFSPFILGRLVTFQCLNTFRSRLLRSWPFVANKIMENVAFKGPYVQPTHQD